MKKINKILILFLFLLSVSFVAVWELLQSKWVARQVSQVATSYIKEVLKADVEFHNLKFNLFPPGAEVKNIRFRGEKNKVLIAVEADSLGVFFNPFDVFKTNFVIDNIVIDDGRVEIVAKRKKKNNKKNKHTPISLDKFELLKDIPVNRAIVRDVNLKFNDFSVYTSELQVKNKRSGIDIDGKFERVNLQHFISKKRFLDSVEVKASIDRKFIVIDSLRLKSDFISAKFKGVITNYVSKNIKYKLQMETKLPINSIHDWVDMKKVGLLNYGIASLNGELRGVGDTFNFLADVELNNFKTDFAYGDNAKLKVGITKKNITFKNFELKSGQQQIRLVKEFEFYNFDTKKFVEEPIIAKANKLRVNNFLRYLRNSLGILEGSITGNIRFDLLEKSFSFKTQDSVMINELKLKASEDFEILSLENFEMEKGEFIIDNGTFLMDLYAKNGDTNFSLNGKINKDTFILNMPTGFLELDKFNNIAGYEMKGRGTFSFDMLKGSDGLVLYTKNDFKQFSVEDYSLDKVKADVDFLIGSSNILIKKLNASSGKSRVYLDGLVNYKSQKIGAKYNISNMNFNEVKKILKPLLKDSELTANEIHGNWDLDGTITGKAKLSEMVINGKLEGKNNYFFDESIDKFKFNYKLDQGVYRVFDLNATKAKGKIFGGLSYSFLNNNLDFNIKVREIPIQDFTYYSKFPLSLKADLFGNIIGGIENSKWFLNTNLKLTKSSVFSKKYNDSTVLVNFDEGEFKVNFDMFKDRINLNSTVYFDKEKSNESFVNVDVDFSDIKEFLGIFSGVDLINTNLSGEFKYSLRSRFDSVNYQLRDLETNVKKLSFKKHPVNVNYYNSLPEIKVKDGEIDFWDVNIRGKRFYVLSEGKGNIKKDYLTTTQWKIDASIIEIFNDVISKANGNIRGKVEFGSKDKENVYDAYVASNNLTLTSNLLPMAITKADTKVSFRDSVLNIDRFNAQLVSGTLDLSGKINLKNVIPDVDLRYEFKDAGMSILKKSNLIFSGTGSLIGKNFPYTLSGDIYIQRFSLVNELTDLGLSSENLSSQDIEYLPGQESYINDQYLNFNMNVITREPVYIRNSLADLGFTGNLQVLGGERDPRLSGKIILAPRNNKITFKNNDFNFSKGNVFFNERNSYKNPDLDFLAATKINDVQISAALLGPVKNVDFHLTSEPNLSQSDILSLIIFGYTEDLSNDLSDAEKESMTRAGVGSIIFDSFKINETLKSEFGLEFNLGTEISKDEGSYLSRKSAEGSTSVGKVNSATKWEVKKKISDAMSMSVSGTVGSATTQKQAVNLNYKVDTNMSLEGVYESTSTDQTETINDDTSVGADIKWKWSFK